MDDFKPELLKALLDWVNTFDLPFRITTLSQLEDGQILWQILNDIDADYFNESLPNFEENHRRQSDNWIPRWQNLKHIERTTSTYIREECEQLPVLTKRMIPDLKTGARDGSTMLVAKLTMAVLLAACFSPRSNQRMLQVMPKLGTKTAETIAEAIQEMQALDQRMSELGVDAELTSDPILPGYRSPTRAASGQPADAIALQQRVDILTARLKSLESETLKQMQENLGLRSDMMSEKDETSQKPFLEQNEKLQTAQSELEELRRRLREQDLQMAELRNELNRKADIDDDVRAASMQKEHERLLVLQERTNDRLRELELANAEKSGLLRAALLDRDNLPPELLELKRVETIQQMREMIESVVKAPPETQPRVLDATSSEIAETVLSSEAALDKAKKDLQDQLDMNESLRVQLEMAKAETAERGSAELQQEVENLRRENALVKSMWYDMNQRLLSNTVILQRRSEAPKGWLGKQRAAVGGGASVLGRR
ncbi:hypothetical protein COCHEDRAFT_30835 [Bipolaris maydis C5]|uniref:HOOK N-terminal domain-containing protein n=1 Tax=Cochliobolus heterostrophus (strain C5 / ATCC 48332 / race O) TaxID=701091 RepID=M2UHA4_COCH5|nr:hypothetical protein COCHEDRAFT_30835 [Bipolaris maydis C5]